MTQERVIAVEPINVQYATILIQGDGDLTLNKMNARAIRELTKERNGTKTVKEVPNIWEDIITAIHWRDGIPVKDTYTECSEELLREMLQNNAPCITGFGLKKSIMDAINRNKVDKNATKLAATINTVQALEPVTFTEHYVDEKLMSPRKGSPVLVRINRFTGWSSQIHIAYTENVYSLDQIVNLINLAGFGIGIGSGRSSGYGRYHVSGIK
jgi:hypothetical protein